MVAQNRDHLLVFVKEQVDFNGVEKASGGYQVYAGAAGQPATYSIGTLCRALVVNSGSKILGCTSAGMPLPLSHTSTRRH